MQDEESIYTIYVGDVQAEAERVLNRRLNDTELYSVKKGLEWGISTSLEVIMHTAIKTAASESEYEFGF